MGWGPPLLWDRGTCSCSYSYSLSYCYPPTPTATATATPTLTFTLTFNLIILFDCKYKPAAKTLKKNKQFLLNMHIKQIAESNPSLTNLQLSKKNAKHNVLRCVSVISTF